MGQGQLQAALYMFELTHWLVPHSGSAGRTVFEGSRAPAASWSIIADQGGMASQPQVLDLRSPLKSWEVNLKPHDVHWEIAQLDFTAIIFVQFFFSLLGSTLQN